MIGIQDLLNERIYLGLPTSLGAWLGWLLFAGLLVWGAWRKRKEIERLSSTQWILWALLAIAAVPAVLFLRLQLPLLTSLPQPGIQTHAESSVVGLLFALPFVLAAGFIGALPALTVGFVSGLVLGFMGTHSIFTPLEIAGMALVFSICIRQRYRTQFFTFLRNPFGAALVTGAAFLPVIVLTAFLITEGSLAARVDYALAQTWVVLFNRGMELLIAGLLGELIYLARFRSWGTREAEQSSPIETSLQTRFLFVTLPLLLGALFSLLVGDWWVAGNAARQMIRDRLSSTANVAMESLPFFLESGQNLIRQLAQPELLSLTPEELQVELGNNIRLIPFFRQVYLWDAQKAYVGGYPGGVMSLENLDPAEQEGINLALKGVMAQTYTIPPAEGETTAQISFITAIQDKQGNLVGVLLGRTDLVSNPFTQPALQALDALQEIGGVGMILDEQGRRLYHPNPALLMQTYQDELKEDEPFYEMISAGGTREWVYYLRSDGRPWSVVLQVPAETTQQLSLDIAVPLLIILFVIIGLVVLILWGGLRRVSSSLIYLSKEAGLIADGKLDRPLKVKSEDEIGLFSRAFEIMRVRLKARLGDLNRLLDASQGVASNLATPEAFNGVLKAALVEGAIAARAVLISDVLMGARTGETVAFGAGKMASQLNYLDEQFFQLVRHQDVIMVPNLSKVKRIHLPADVPHPWAAILLALRHENQYYGCLWVAFETAHDFTDEEVRFLTTLAWEAALAAANARLFVFSEVGRQRLEAILESTPDPVLVIDGHRRLLLVNPAATQLAGIITSPIPGRLFEEVTDNPDLLDLIRVPLDKKSLTREISISGGKVYFVSISPVDAVGIYVGKIIILRDITQYKEINTLKSDFVATVSHDLRSPLTLMRGYSTMVQMVGELNEQQTDYVKKITQSVDSMTRLVNNLLDLGRIEAGVGLQLENIAVDELVTKAVNDFQVQATQKNIKLSVDVPQGLEPLEADKALVQQSLMNLVDNAIKYTPINGTVRVQVKQKEDAILFEVQDTGIGVAPLDLPHLFEKFYRSGRREAYQQRGTGLGLAIVKSIADRHGGRVWVESQLGKGSTFFFLIPLKQPQVKPGAAE